MEDSSYQLFRGLDPVFQCPCSRFEKDEFDICMCGHAADEHDEDNDFNCLAEI